MDPSQIWDTPQPPKAYRPTAALEQALPGTPEGRSLCGRLGPAPSRPHPANSPGLDNPRSGCGQARNGREMIDDFRLPGSRMWRRRGGPLTKGVAHVGGALGGACFWPPQRFSLRGRSPRRCGRGLAWKALLEAGWYGFRASAATRRSEAAPRVSLARPARRTGGKKVVRATPWFSALVRHRGGRSHHRVPADCFGEYHKAFFWKELHSPRRCSTPHLIHRDKRDFLGPSWSQIERQPGIASRQSRTD